MSCFGHKKRRCFIQKFLSFGYAWLRNEWRDMPVRCSAKKICRFCMPSVRLNRRFVLLCMCQCMFRFRPHSVFSYPI